MADDDFEATPDSGGTPDQQGFSLKEAVGLQPEPKEAPQPTTGKGWTLDEASAPPKPFSLQEAMGQEEPETSAAGVGAREFLRNAIPTTVGAVAGLAAGVPVGAATTAAAGPIAGAVAGFGAGAAVGAGAAAGTRKIQDEVADYLGLDSPKQRATDVKEHPWAATAGGLAPAVATFSPGKLAQQIGQRVLSGGIMGGINIGQQAIEKGISEIDPTEAAIATGVGVALPKARPWAEGAAAGALEGVGLSKAAGSLRHDLLPKAEDHDAEVAAATPSRPVAGNSAGTSATHVGPPGKASQEAVDGLKRPTDTATVQEGAAETTSTPISTGEASQDPTIQAVFKRGQALGLDEESGPQGVDWSQWPPRERVVAPSEQVAPPPAEQPPVTGERVPPGGDRPLGSRLMPTREEPGAGPRAIAGDQAATVGEQLKAKRAASFADELKASQPPKGEGVAPTIDEQLAQRGHSPETIRAMSPQQKAYTLEQQEPPEPVKPQPTLQAKAQPQSLSAGAALGAKNYSPGQVAQAKSKLGDLYGKLTRPWNMWFAAENLKATDVSDPRLFANAVREAQGTTVQARDAIDRENAFNHEVNQLPGNMREEAAATFQSGNIPPNNPMSRFATALTKQEADYRNRLGHFDPEGNWQSNFLPYMFKDPVAAQNELTQWKLDGRKGPFTIGDFMNAKHQLRDDLRRADGSIDFPKLVENLNNSRDRYLMMRKTIDTSINDGNISEVQRPGDVRLEGVTHRGMPLYAQEDIAMMFDRHFDPKRMDPASKSFYQAAQRVKNAGTAWQMMLGAYHLFAETGEAMNGDVMRAVSDAASGNFGGAAKKLAMSPTAAIRQAAGSATRALKAYRGEIPNDKLANDAMGDLVRGGLTAKVQSIFTPDANSAHANFWGSWGKAADMLSEHWQQGKKSPRDALNETFKVLGETMQTLQHPLFNVYIPRLKIGAALEQMSDYRSANPNKTTGEYQEVAKRILKSIDDRLGEMNQSTLFWNKVFQRGANMALISPSWQVGNFRGFMGGMASLIKNPGSLSIKNPDFQPNAAFPLAFAITTAAIGSMYQFLKTRQMPGDVQSAFYPHTGGQGGKEQVILPGYLKDVYGWWSMLAHHESLPKQAQKELYNKLSLVPHMAWDTMSNKDWADKQIYNPSAPIAERVQQYLQYVHQSMHPIAYSQATKSEKGSNISLPERTVGIRKAPSEWAGRDNQNNKAQQQADQFRAKQRAKLGN